jgi:hypothetical protein
VPWVAPVGVSGGLNTGFTGIPDDSGLVRLGGGIAMLEPDLFRLWRGAAAAPQLDELVQSAAGERIEDAEGKVRDLEEEGLVVIESPDIEPVVRRLAISLVGDLLGNEGDARSPFIAVGRRGARIQLPVADFELLLRSDGATTVGTICDGLRGSPLSTDGSDVLRSICLGLPELVRHQVVRLDRPGEEAADGRRS